MALKKLLALLVSAALCLALPACGAPESVPSPSAEPPATPAPIHRGTELEMGGSLSTGDFVMSFDALELVPEFTYDTSDISSNSIWVEPGYMLLILRGTFENLSDRVISTDSFKITVSVNELYFTDSGRVRFELLPNFGGESEPGSRSEYVVYIYLPEQMTDLFETAAFDIYFNDDYSRPELLLPVDGEPYIGADHRCYLITGLREA